MEATLDLSANQYRQSGPISLHLGWLSCANLLANPQQILIFKFSYMKNIHFRYLLKDHWDISPHIFVTYFLADTWSDVKNVYAVIRTKMKEWSHKNMVAHLEKFHPFVYILGCLVLMLLHAWSCLDVSRLVTFYDLIMNNVLCTFSSMNWLFFYFPFA